MIRNFYKYCRVNILAIVFTILIVFLTHGSRLFIKNATIDISLFINNPQTNYNWLDIGRWGAVLTKNISELRNFNPYVANSFGILFITFACILWSFSFFQISKKNCSLYWIFGIIFFTNPVFSLQWLFYIQIFEVAFALCLIPIVLINIFQWIEKEKIFNLVIGIIGMVWVFATYQSMVIVYVVGAIICFILYQETHLKKLIIVVIKLIGSFLVSYLFYAVITKYFFSSSNYLDSQIAWKTQEFSVCIKNIMHYVLKVVTGEGIFYNKSYLAIVILLFIIFIIEIKRISIIFSLKWLSIFLLLIMPFALSIYMGTQSVERSQFALGAVIASGFLIIVRYFVYNKKIIINKVMLGFVCCLMLITLEKQMYTSMKIYYSDDIRYQEDITILKQIADDIYDINADLNKPLVFIGERNAQLNESAYKIEDIVSEYYARTSLGLFSWVEPYYYNSTNLILDVYKTIGFSFRYPSVEQISEGRKFAKTMASWPKKGSVQEMEDIIVIKLSEDIYGK